MMDNDTRITLSTLRENFFTAWSQGDWHSLVPHLSMDAKLSSSQHGDGQGKAEWGHLLANDAALLAWMRTSNHAIVIGKDGNAVASSYVIGLFEREQQQFLFGASVILRFQFSESTGWLLCDIRIQVNWCKGNLVLAAHWRLPPSDAGWQLGDVTPVIVSELDSPWALIRNEELQTDIEGAVRQLYSKYAWAIDQGDITLLSDSYTEDAAGGFTPMGKLQGRHEIIGQQKSFRRHWPWMQHFADVLRIELEDDGQHARMIVGRIIPERPMDEAAHMLYGAHYQLRTRLESDNQWRICWFDYRPGWFSAENVPKFEIGVTQA